MKQDKEIIKEITKEMKSVTLVDEKGESIGNEIRGIVVFKDKFYVSTEKGIFYSEDNPLEGLKCNN